MHDRVPDGGMSDELDAVYLRGWDDAVGQVREYLAALADAPAAAALTTKLLEHLQARRPSGLD